MENRPLITLTGVSAAYEGKTVLHDIHLTIYEDDFLGIIGPNGGGKTTLIKLILGLHAPSSGKIQFLRNGEPCSTLRTGYLPQYSTFDKKFPISVRDVVLSGLHSRRHVIHRFLRADRQKADNILREMYLDDIADRAIGELSGGQRQRVLLGRALICDPELLILDEPGTYIDREAEERMYRLLSDLNRHCAIILVSHDIGTVLQNVRNIACVNRTLHYHPANEVTPQWMEQQSSCPFEMIAHGHLPHRILGEHE